ncbi:CHAT domain-containing protein [Streptomyces sp. NPDC019443]|uniref:CHAT domain-containing tetratricopeptide repeat protein n=1 Tax=Streptomyces sp. NPDC019443 TaxID=3365061 RepID=UPI00378CB8F9
MRDRLLTEAGRTLHALLAEDRPADASDAPDASLVSDLARWVAANPADKQAAVALGWLYWCRYELLGAQDDLDDAVRMLSPFFFPGDLVPDPLKAEIADAYGTHVHSQLAEVLATDGDVGEELSGLVLWCRYLVAHADPQGERMPDHLTSLAVALVERHRILEDPGDLLEAVSLLSRAARDTPAGSPSMPTVQGNLASALTRRFNLTGSANDLRTACEACASALALPLEDAHRDSLAAALGSLLTERLPRALEEEQWEEAVEAGRMALERPELRAFGMEGIATALKRRFKRRGSYVADLDEAIRLREQLLREAPGGLSGGRHVHSLRDLAYLYWLRYQHLEGPEDLDAVIDTNERALSCAPDDPAPRAEMLKDLVIALMERVERRALTGDRPGPDERRDLERIITASRAGLAVHADHPLPSRVGTVLAHALPRALRLQFRHTHRVADLDEAAETLRSTTAAHTGSPDQLLAYATEAAETHRARYRAGAGLDALQEAVAARRQAVSATPEPDPQRSETLAGLALSLVALYTHTGDLAQLDEAVGHGREAVRAIPADAQEGPEAANPLHALGTSLMQRGRRTGSLGDLNAAVEALRRQKSLSGTDQAPLHNLGLALSARAERTGDTGDLDEAVAVLREATGPLGDEEEANLLGGLSGALLRRYRGSGDRADLEEALAIGRRAADAVPEGDPESLSAFTPLIAALLDEHQRGPGRVDIDELVALCRRLVDVAPPDHAALGLFRHNLGAALKAQADVLDAENEVLAMAAAAGMTGGISGNALDAFGALTQAVRSEVLPPSQRINSARDAAVLVAPMETAWAQELLEYAVGLIPLVAPSRIERADQQHALKDLSELVTLTAAAALDAGSQPHPDPQYPGMPLLPHSADRSLRTLEQGRAVLLGQMLETRGDDVSELRRLHPDLAKRFVKLRSLIDSEAAPPGEAMEYGSDERPRAATELAATIEEIRRLEGFGSFARPPKAEDLVAEAVSGPIVVFNCHPGRSDALLVTAAGIRHLPLPGLSYDELSQQADLFHRTLPVIDNPDSSWREQRAAQGTLSRTLGWLWDVAAEPVLLALGIGPRVAGDDEPPRVWWSPGGLLGALPLHAAGHHAESVAKGLDRTVMDRVVSSYTPTVRALRHARRARPVTGEVPEERSLIVAMPFTPGAPPLAGTAEEVAAVAAHLPNAALLTGPEDGVLAPGATAPTRDAVLAGLSEVSAVHLACHAHTDPVDPSGSRLLLWDHETAPLTVAGVASVTLDRAQLAYLSACRTTFTAAADLLDEAIHLTSAFQLAGFRHVVGTLWEVDDVVAGRIAGSFYESLQGPRGLDYARSAAALRASVLAVRDDFPRTPSLWAGHLHAGA